MAAVRMGRIDGKLVVNPLISELEQSDISMVVAAKPDSIVMLEGGAQIVDEEAILEALFTAHEEMRPVFELQQELRRLAGKTKREFTKKEFDPEPALPRCKSGCRPTSSERSKSAARRSAAPRFTRLQDKRCGGTRRRAFRTASTNSKRRAKRSCATACARVILDDDRRIDDRSSTEIRR